MSRSGESLSSHPPRSQLPRRARAVSSRAILHACSFAILLAGIAASAAAQPILTPDPASPAPAGTPIVWTVVGAGVHPTWDYRLRIGPEGGPLRKVQDYDDAAVFTWAPLDEGTYTVEVTARDRVTRALQFVLEETYVVTARATGGTPLVTATAHPLIALFSAPPCDAGSMRVRFSAPGALAQVTNAKPCDGVHGVNFWIAGMRGGATYELRSEIRDETGALLDEGPPLAFTTGAPDVTLPNVSITTESTTLPSRSDEVMLASVAGPASVPGTLNLPFAIDLSGALVWYARPYPGKSWLPTRLVDGGRLLLIEGVDLREIDLAGYTLRATSAARISEQLVQQGFDPIGGLHHEITELPNGHLAVLATVERLLEDVQGPGFVDVVGDMVVVLTPNLNVAWAWNAFDHLDPARLATLGETCPGSGCPPLHLAPTGTDWLHSNSIAYSPADGNLLVSVRHQDWVLKLDYRNGAGTGEVLWRLGRDGDFTLGAGDLESWPYHQHDASYVGDDLVAMYSNGNASPACVDDPLACESRALVFHVNEATRVATPVLDARLGLYSPALGTAQRLANGNQWVDSGFLGFPDTYSVLDELTPEGQRVLSVRTDGTAMYRAIRSQSLYAAPVPAPEPSGVASALTAAAAVLCRRRLRRAAPANPAAAC